MFAFSSKYALALYELVQKRGNLKYKNSEEIPLARFRILIGVEPERLSEFKNLKLRAIDPAVLEVNGLGEFGCKIEPVYRGRKVTAIRLSWWQKNIDEKKATRLLGTVEQVTPAPPRLVPPPVPLPPRGWSGLSEQQFNTLRSSFPGTDIQEMEAQFVAWNTEKGTEPENYVGALYGFIKRKLQREQSG